VVKRTLKLNEFKALYKALETGTVWIDHLLLGFLYWLESKVINVRVKNEVNEAIKEYYSLHGELSPTHSPDTVSPVYRETPSKTSTSLPEMRLTAPWYKESQDDVEGR
jgi:hypothetical protein